MAGTIGEIAARYRSASWRSSRTSFRNPPPGFGMRSILTVFMTAYLVNKLGQLSPMGDAEARVGDRDLGAVAADARLGAREAAVQALARAAGGQHHLGVAGGQAQVGGLERARHVVTSGCYD